MFGFFKKDSNIYAFADGVCRDISECKDATFADKLLGDGIMIVPESNVIYSPCNAKVETIFPTKHALGLVMQDGKEILLHIGINTVNLNGNGFKCLIKVGKKVNAGDPIIEFDKKLMEENNLDMSTMLVVVESKAQQMNKHHINKKVAVKELILKFE